MKKLILPSILLLVYLIHHQWRSSFLYDFDSVAFAMALDDYDVSRFRPHPPGYPLYILLARLAMPVSLTANSALVTASTIASLATLMILYLIGKKLYSQKTASLASIMLAMSPLFWTYANVSASYATGGMMGCVVVLTCLSQKPRPLISGFLLGLSGGFRPDVMIVFAPMVAYFSWKSSKLKGLIEASASSLAGAALWIIPTVLLSQGFGPYLDALDLQSRSIEFSNAARGMSRLKFTGINTAKLACYSAWAMGPLGILMFAYGIIKKKTDNGVLFLLWLAPYSFLVTLVAFGQPGMMLSVLPGAFLFIARTIDSFNKTWLKTLVPSIICASSAAAFIFAPGLDKKAFTDERTNLIEKVKTEFFLFSGKGIQSVDKFYENHFEFIKTNFPPEENVVFTNLAGWPQATYYLGGFKVHNYFSFSGFDKPYPDPDIHLPEGSYSLPKNTKHIILFNGNKHSLALNDSVTFYDETKSGSSIPKEGGSRTTLRWIPVAQGSIIRFHDGKMTIAEGT